MIDIQSYETCHTSHSFIKSLTLIICYLETPIDTLYYLTGLYKGYNKSSSSSLLKCAYLRRCSDCCSWSESVAAESVSGAEVEFGAGAGAGAEAEAEAGAESGPEVESGVQER